MTEEHKETEEEIIEDNFEDIMEPIEPGEFVSKGGVPVKQQLLLVAVVLALIFGTSVTSKIVATFKDRNADIPAAIPSTIEDINVNEREATVEPFSDVEILGKAAYVWDINNQRALYKKNEAESLPLASVTKLMTALIAHEVLSEDSTVTIDDNAISQDGDSGLFANESFDRQSLSDLVLQSSSNDGAFALASVAGNKLGGGADDFVKAMNVRAEELGLHQTKFYNPTGLDLSRTQAGAYGSAKDMAFLMEYILKNEPSILESTKGEIDRYYSDQGFYHDAENTNYYIDEMPALIGSKTGYTDLAGGNLVIAYDAGLNRPVAIAVLGSTQSNRFTDVMTLIEATNDHLSQ